MSKSKFTPGPWSVAGNQTDKPGFNEQRHIFSSYDRKHSGTGCIATVPSSDANAALIAAAPELLSALTNLVRSLPITGNSLAVEKDIADALRALAKAGGRDNE